jgi:hypothetical protein
VQWTWHYTDNRHQNLGLPISEPCNRDTYHGTACAQISHIHFCQTSVLCKSFAFTHTHTHTHTYILFHNNIHSRWFMQTHVYMYPSGLYCTLCLRILATLVCIGFSTNYQPLWELHQTWHKSNGQTKAHYRITFACSVTTPSITFISTNYKTIQYFPDYPTSTYTTFCLIQHGHMMYCAQFHATYVYTYAFNPLQSTVKFTWIKFNSSDNSPVFCQLYCRIIINKQNLYLPST